MTTQAADAVLQQHILDLEAKRIDAMIREDIETLDDILADDLTYTHSSGRTDTKATFLELIQAPGSHYLGVDYSNVDVTPSGDAVIVRGRAQIRLAREDGERPDYPVLFVDVYIRRDGRWQMVAWQATRVPE